MVKKYINLITKGIVLIIFGIYRLLLRPLLMGKCRFNPSCSHYAQPAFQYHGFWRGNLLVFKRLLRCHPWGLSGYDPIPYSQEKKNGK